MRESEILQTIAEELKDCKQVFIHAPFGLDNLNIRGKNLERYMSCIESAFKYNVKYGCIYYYLDRMKCEPIFEHKETYFTLIIHQSSKPVVGYIEMKKVDL